MQDDAHVHQVKARHEAELFRKPNVVCVAIGRHRRRQDCLALFVCVTHKVALEELPPQDRIPAELEGVTVHVKAIGEPTALRITSRILENQHESEDIDRS